MFTIFKLYESCVVLLFPLFYFYLNIIFYLVLKSDHYYKNFINYVNNFIKTIFPLPTDVLSRHVLFIITNTSEEENEKINSLCLRFLNTFILEKYRKEP